MPNYELRDPSQVASPALLFQLAVIESNIARMIARAGSVDRLRPHCKTHKTREIVRLQMKAGITKHKAATIAEAEMLAQEKAPDILLAYPIIGPNAARFAKLIRTYPESTFATLADSETGLADLARAKVEAEILLDIDVGQHRTGVAPAAAVDLYAKLAATPGLRPGGLHVYDGHNHQESLDDRTKAIHESWAAVSKLRDEIIRRGLPVLRLVLGGTPTFPVWAEINLPGIELSPGTCVLNDHGYGSRFKDMNDLEIAAVILTRVVSKPTPTRITLDVGNKAVASDPPVGKRVRIIDLPDAQQVIHNEEHLVLETPRAARIGIGDVFYAIPTHICPTCALHQEAVVVRDGEVVDRWMIAARDRRLTI